MICIEAEIPLEICDIDDELKAIYHSRESFCIWVFSTRVERNRFVEETIGMSKDQRQEHFDALDLGSNCLLEDVGVLKELTTLMSEFFRTSRLCTIPIWCT